MIFSSMIMIIKTLPPYRDDVNPFTYILSWFFSRLEFPFSMDVQVYLSFLFGTQLPQLDYKSLCNKRWSW